MGKYKILVADDDIYIIRHIMSALMKNPDYVVLTTGNGKAAYEIANIEYPDLIIMDWEMPEMNGIEVTRLLKQNQTTKDIPIIIATGIMVDSNDLRFALDSGALDYLRKPIDETELNARVENMLRLSAAHFQIKQQNVLLQSQLTARLVNLQQLNEMTFTAAKHLTTMKEQATYVNKQFLMETIAMTERLLQSKAYVIDWADFESHLEILFQGFLFKLKDRYGNFTRNELRLCAFLKLGMSSKEIAAITYTSPNSVNIARKRLKKKFGLQSDESLQLFMQNL